MMMKEEGFKLVKKSYKRMKGLRSNMRSHRNLSSAMVTGVLLRNRNLTLKPAQTRVFTLLRKPLQSVKKVAVRRECPFTVQH